MGPCCYHRHDRSIRTNSPLSIWTWFRTWTASPSWPATSGHGIEISRFDGKKRARFRIPSFPYAAGKYWVTIGLSSRENGHLYHVQTQRYLFEVIEVPRVQEPIDVAVQVEVEDL
jgi:hypothetical protein